MARMTIERSDHLECGLWLVFDRNGAVRMTRTEPRLDRNERAMFIQAKLPLALWSTPSLRATIDVQADGAPTISIDLLADALRSSLGVDVDLRVIAPAEGQ